MKRVALGEAEMSGETSLPTVNEAVVGHGVEFRRLAQFCEFSRFSVSVENERSQRQAHEFSPDEVSVLRTSPSAAPAG
jgi:hypothetical protein